MKDPIHFSGEPDRFARTRKLFEDRQQERAIRLIEMTKPMASSPERRAQIVLAIADTEERLTPPWWLAIIIVVVGAVMLGAGWIALSGLLLLAE